MTTPEQQKKQALFWLEYSQQLSNSIRYVEALRAVQRAIALDELNAEAWYAQGTCYAMLANYEEALTNFEHALQLDETNVQAWDGKAWVLGILGRHDEAVTAVDYALQLDPDYREAKQRKKRLQAFQNE